MDHQSIVLWLVFVKLSFVDMVTAYPSMNMTVPKK